jgi:predicted anti-sigma-YlaC factor YlaD
MYQEYNRNQSYRRRKSSSVLGSILRFVVFIMIALAVLTGGLWLIGATIGLAVGLFTLALALAPVIFVVWLVWLVFKAIFF